ncbi:hypothetical protein HDE79_003624 [Rhodanobacter sp. MP1X3]|nr:hypothetical protein [Rhodanobacter sp. MP1X3]
MRQHRNFSAKNQLHFKPGKKVCGAQDDDRHDKGPGTTMAFCYFNNDHFSSVISSQSVRQDGILAFLFSADVFGQ